MTKDVERLSSAEHRPKSPTERFDDITESLMPLMRKDSFMGEFTMPNLRVGETDMRFSVFRPGLAERSYYSPSILCHKLVIKEQGVISFLAPESEIFLRRNGLDAEEDTGKLEELLIALAEYDSVARRLSSSKARRLGFSEEFVKSQSKIKRAGRFLAKTLKIAAD